MNQKGPLQIPLITFCKGDSLTRQNFLRQESGVYCVACNIDQARQNFRIRAYTALQYKKSIYLTLNQKGLLRKPLITFCNKDLLTKQSFLRQESVVWSILWSMQYWSQARQKWKIGAYTVLQHNKVYTKHWIRRVHFEYPWLLFERRIH